MRAVALIVLVGLTGRAVADTILDEDVALKSQVGWGASLSPDRIALTSEAGWSGADRRVSANAVAEATVYTPEGFSEPGGELETVAVVSRLVHRDAVRAMAAYGRDVEGSESDAELGASYVHRLTGAIMIGRATRFRRGITVAPGQPRWDAISGPLGGIRIGRSRCELMLAADAIATTSVHTGLLGLVSVGADL